MAQGFLQIEKKIPSTTSFPWYWTFTSQFFYRSLRHFVPNPPSLHFRFWADRVDTFKQMNVELQTFKLSKDGSKQNVCIFSTKFRWSPMTFTSKFFRRTVAEPESFWWGGKLLINTMTFQYDFFFNLIELHDLKFWITIYSQGIYVWNTCIMTC
jgi:hypothetical protein